MKNLIKIAEGFALTAVLGFSIISCGNNDSDFVSVAGGTVKGAAYSGEKGVFPEGRTVTLSSFYIDKYEVTQEEYRSVMEGQKVNVNGTEYIPDAFPSYCTGSDSDFGIDYGKNHSNYPVENVTWYDALWYCNALSKKEGLEPCYTITVKTVKENHITAAEVSYDNKKNGYRLPTEAEWEYAARGGDPAAKDWNYVFSGADTADGAGCDDAANSGLDTVGWYCYNNKEGTTGISDVTGSADGKGTHEIGKKKANRLGLYDMSGNVWEWCWDRYGSISQDETVTDPKGTASGNLRIYRGGSWSYFARYASVSYRYSILPGFHGSNLGFRVCRNAE